MVLNIVEDKRLSFSPYRYRHIIMLWNIKIYRLDNEARLNVRQISCQSFRQICLKAALMDCLVFTLWQEIYSSYEEAIYEGVCQKLDGCR